ncbi:MAG: UDP-glucose 4-epimerase GalE, partial [Schleiferilactobacillus harbinensis]
PADVGPRRPGEPATLVASSETAKKILGGEPQYDDMEKIIATAWHWDQTHPNGYNDRR